MEHVGIVFQASVADAIEVALGAPSHGDPADRPDLHGDLPGVPAALGRGLARIHRSAVPPGAVPIDLAAAINGRLDAGQVTAGLLPEPYDRYEPSDLVRIWNESTLPASYTARPVPTIGAVSVTRMLLRGGELTGITGDHGLVADAHLDLAVLQHTIHHTLGPEAVFGFYEAYGSDPNIVVLDHYVLTALLLGWIE